MREPLSWLVTAVVTCVRRVSRIWGNGYNRTRDPHCYVDDNIVRRATRRERQNRLRLESRDEMLMAPENERAKLRTTHPRRT